MKREKASSFGQVWKRFTTALLTVMMITAYMPLAGKAAAADADSSDYQVIITQRTDAESGFVHPGVGLTKPLLENVREQIQNEVDPWYSYYVEMSKHAYAATNVASSNQSAADPTKPDSKAFSSQGFNSRFIQDGLKAYTQALMYVITGEEVYRENGMRIIRIWSQMDPAQYAYFTDSHIHTGIPLNRIVMAAEILRYTSTENPALEWTEQDTTDFTDNLITPVINTFMNSNNYFMNQHNYPILGAMAGYIFTDNKAGYEKEVEWWSVNKDANDQGFNGSIKRLFRLIDTNDVTGEPVDPPVVQHIEMGRDQAHGGGDLTNAAIATRMMLAQGTKLDPMQGTVSQAANAVDPLEFLDHRIIKAADYFWQFMLGYEPEWVPVAYSIAPDGTIKDTYNRISSQYKGRFLTANFWDFYSYYTYGKGENIAEIAPYYAEAFTKKQFLNWQNVDGGDDYWLYLPAEAAADADKFLPPQQTNLGQRNEVEIRYTALDGQTEKLTEGDVQFIRFNATEEGAKIALLSGGTGVKTIGFKIRSNGIAQLDMGTGVKATLTLPDTDGEWRYVTYTMNEAQYMGDFFDLKIRGTVGTTVDMDHISFDAATALNPPVFQLGSSDSEIFSYIGVPINLDFSAKGAAAASIVYGSTNLPAGAELDGNTGAFSWEPDAAGQYAFVVTASDGTTVTAKNVVIHLSVDRNSAIAETIAPYDEHTSYSKTSLAEYKAVYEETVSKSATLSDEEFIQQLLILRSAVEGFQLVSPQAFDESLDFSKMIQGVSVLLDGDNDTFWGFATGPQPNRVLDFGADFKVSADAFAVQSRMNFTDRGAGIAIYGSNDAVNWTKLTPEQTPFNSGLNRLEVAEQFKQEKYRYIKMQMDTKHPDIIHNSVQGILEIGEFRIYGERYEAGNRIESISFDTTQSNKGKVVAGDTVKVNIKATEEISDVKVKIQGIDAQVYTEDGINWVASIVMGTETASGPLSQVIVEYNQKNGQPGATAYSTTDNSKLNFVNESDIIQNVLAITDVTGSDARYDAANMKTRMQALFDNNELTFTEFWGLAANGHGSFVTFDFRAGHQVQFSGVEFLARRDQLGRLAGAYIQGSNDMVTWTTLTDAAAGISGWQYMESKDKTTKYRYIRINNPLFWFGNMAEVRFHGEVISTLPDLLKQAQEIDRSIYTAASLTNLDAAISGGEAVIANSAATEADVSTAIASLQAALQALKYEQGMPVLELADQLVVAGSELAFNVQAVNVDGAAEVAYEVVEELPAGAVFDTDTHRFTWTPAMDQGGLYTLTFKAAAGDKASAKTIKIKVIGKPVVDVNELVEQIDAKVGQTITYRVPVLPDASGEPLVFTAAQLPTGAVINSMNGMFKWTPTNADYGTHSIILKASNGSFEVEVPIQLDVALNILPAENYTQGSYYTYSNELARIEAELNKPGANKAALAREIAIAEKALVRVPLPIYSVVKDQDGSDTELITDIKTGTTELAEGKFESGRAVSFKGGTNDYLQLSAEPPFKNYDEVTIATWVKWDGGSDWQRIFDFGNNTNQYLFLTPKSGNNTLRFAIKNGGAEQFIQTSAMPTNQWVHVAVTLGSGTGKLYVNGELKATGNMSIKLSDIKPGLNYIAKSQFAADALFRGSVDRFTVYNYVLSEAEIQASMTAPVQWVDKTLLESLLIQADQLLESDHTANSWSALESVMTNADSVYDNAASTQTAVDEAAVALKTALQQLVNVAALNEAIAEANQLLAAVDEQTSESAVEELQAAVDAAALVLTNDAATQGEVDSAVESLEQAIDAYKEAIKPTVDKSALNDLIAEALTALNGAEEGEEPGQYPAAAIAALEGAIDAAQAVAENPAVDQATVEAALSAIEEALEAFNAAVNKEEEGEPEPTVDKSALNDLIAEALTVLNGAEEGEEPGQYPAAAIAALEGAIDAAQAVAENPAVDQAAVEAALSALEEALEAFNASVNEEEEGEPEPSEDTAAPIWQEGSAVTASKVGTASVTLTWVAATDNVEVTGYKVSWTVGTRLETRDVEGTNITIRGLQSGTSYTFKVTAGDGADNWSTELEVSVTTKNYVPPVEPEQPEQPGQPEQPEQPEQPGQPEQPEQPEQPGQPEQPEQPEQPQQPQVEFKDVPETHWAASAIKRAAALGIVKGHLDNTFKPDASTTRAEFMTMLANAFKWQGEQAELTFKDKEQIGAWAEDAIAQGIQRGVITGYTDGSFRPNQEITRAEMIVMLARALDIAQSANEHTGFADDAAIPAWGKAAVEAMRELGVITGRGNNSFAPNEVATRAEALVIIMRVLEKNN